MKEIIKNNITMLEILDKYNITRKKDFFLCPFHKDKHPSAKAYKNSFYCFACGKNSDIIGFVQYYFNISFKEAMQKINQDFNLGLDSNTKIDYKKINEIKKQRKQKELKKQQQLKKYIYLSEQYRNIRNKILQLKSEINILNWEDKESESSKLEMKLSLLEIKLEGLEKLF